MEALSARYPIWFCDVWGVVHNGVAAFGPAIEALARHRAHGGTAILLTNAPRPAASIERQLLSLGIGRHAYDGIVTSGDVTASLLAAYEGQGIHHLGPERDLALLGGLEASRVGLAEADVVLCTGLFDDARETPDDYERDFAAMAERRLTMICANPDKLVRRGPSLIYCAGALAERYQALGGRVLMAGKPFTPVYDLARAMAARLRNEAIEATRVLAIGDGPETDIRGAADYGLDAVLIAGGVSESSRTLKEIERAVRAEVPHARIVRTLRDLRWGEP